MRITLMEYRAQLNAENNIYSIEFTPQTQNDPKRKQKKLIFGFEVELKSNPK